MDIGVNKVHNAYFFYIKKCGLLYFFFVNVAYTLIIWGNEIL